MDWLDEKVTKHNLLIGNDEYKEKIRDVINWDSKNGNMLSHYLGNYLQAILALNNINEITADIKNDYLKLKEETKNIIKKASLDIGIETDEIVRIFKKRRGWTKKDESVLKKIEENMDL